MMEQEDISELPGGPTEVSESAPMVLDEEEQLIVDEPAPHEAAAESFPALPLMAASPPSVDSTGRPTPVHRTRPSKWVASNVPLAPATPLPLQSQWGHYKPPSKPTVPRKETPKLSAAAMKKAPPVATPQPPPRDETPAPQEMVSTYSQCFTLLLSALPLRCKKLIILICFRLLIHSLNRVLIPLEFL